MITLSRSPWLLLLLLQILITFVDRSHAGDWSDSSDWSYWSDFNNNNNIDEQGQYEEDDPYKTGIRFELYTRENPDEPELVDIYGETTLPLQHFKPYRPTKVLTHGWMSDGLGVTALRKAFLATMDSNVITVNWTNIDTMFYPLARYHVPLVGRRVAYLVNFLRDAHGVSPAKLHLIGHSLGAHISGMAGSMVEGGEGGAVGRITGLDPAGPLFPSDQTKRLDKADAVFVDVIHTCANVLGYKEAIGHVDFYPNGGTCIQPGCTFADITRGSCSHNRAYDFMEESIYRTDSFKAFPCAGANGYPDFDHAQGGITMGLGVPTDATGTFCLKTSDKAPFAIVEDRHVQLRLFSIHSRINSPSSHRSSSNNNFGNDLDIDAGMRPSSEDPHANRIFRSFMQTGANYYGMELSDRQTRIQTRTRRRNRSRDRKRPNF